MVTISYMTIMIIVAAAFVVGLISPLFLIFYVLMRAEIK